MARGRLGRADGGAAALTHGAAQGRPYGRGGRAGWEVIEGCEGVGGLRVGGKVGGGCVEHANLPLRERCPQQSPCVREPRARQVRDCARGKSPAARHTPRARVQVKREDRPQCHGIFIAAGVVEGIDDHRKVQEVVCIAQVTSEEGLARRHIFICKYLFFSSDASSDKLVNKPAQTAYQTPSTEHWPLISRPI